MIIQLINGHFTAQEAIEILTQMIHVKIKFHENKIHKTANEEDIKFRENKIKQLQKELYNATQHILVKGKSLDVFAAVELE
jgi:hypothetical protein